MQTNVHIPRWNDESIQLACGIANAGGGNLYVGTTSRSKNGTSKYMKRRFEQIPEIIERELQISCSAIPIMHDGKLHLEIAIPPAEVPLSCNGAFWYYKKGKNTTLSREEMLRAWSEDASAAWELRGLPLVEPDDINDMMINLIKDLPLSNIEGGEGLIDTIESRLLHLNLIQSRSRHLDNAGAVLLCKNPTRFIPGASVRIVAFDDAGHETDEQIEIMGPLARLIEETVRIIFSRYLPAISTTPAFVKGLPPREAVREAVANALVHKNYESAVPVRVSVYPSQLCIDNVGRMPEEWTEQDVFGHHAPRPRNPVIAAVARTLHLVSGWGVGIESMRLSCKEANVAPPKFTLTTDETLVTFELPATKRGIDAVRSSKKKAKDSETDNEHQLSSIENSDATPNPQVPGVLQSAVSASGNEGGLDLKPLAAKTVATTRAEVHVERSVKASATRGSAREHIGATPLHTQFIDHSIAAANRLDMTSTDEYVLRVLATNGRVSAHRIAEVLGVSERTVRRSFKKLKEYGFVERIGSDKAGYWRINE